MTQPAVSNAVSRMRQIWNDPLFVRIAVTDVITEMIWRQLIQLLEQEAPRVDLHAVPYTMERTHQDLREAHGFVDSYLDQKGLSRRIAATVNQFSIVPQVLRESDLIAAVPQLITQDCGFLDGLWLGELPFPVDPTSLYLIWHNRHDRDPGIVWLRGHLETLMQERGQEIMAQAPCSSVT